ncbi:MAG: hypothetical protein NVV74_14400 [Magnetospirillum sp.]|nr:hypothetical protein [Magnetospirillum sp.]
MRVEELAAPHLPAFVAAIDAVFVTARGRNGSVAERWPALFRPGGARCFAVLAEGAPIAGLVARPVRCQADDRQFIAHQVGFVFTLLPWRGRGLAARVLHAAAEQVPGPLVLWATRPGLYAKLGWEAWDPHGAKGEWRGEGGTGNEAPVLMPSMLPDLEAIRARARPRRVARSEQDWLARPFGAARMLVARVPQAYALFAQQDGRAILYELVGDPAHYDALWPHVVQNCRSALLNLDAESDAARWLRQRGVTPHPNPLSMWLRWPPADRWSLDWLDRI